MKASRRKEKKIFGFFFLILSNTSSQRDAYLSLILPKLNVMNDTGHEMTDQLPK
jgi:hypothetical protein